MGNQGKPYALVSMTNKDVYYVSVEKGREIADKIGREADSVFAIDIKSGARLNIAVHHVSSVIFPEGKFPGGARNA